MAVAARLDRPHPILDHRASGERDHWRWYDPLFALPCTHRSDSAIAVQDWHVHIDQYEVVAFGLELIDRNSSVLGGIELVRSAPKKFLHQQTIVFLDHRASGERDHWRWYDPLFALPCTHRSDSAIAVQDWHVHIDQYEVVAFGLELIDRNSSVLGGIELVRSAPKKFLHQQTIVF